MANKKNKAAEEATPAAAPERNLPNVKWDDSTMNTAYANVVNVASTREEVTLFFGTNQTWNAASEKEVRVLLSDRMILSPFAAKRLWVLMSGVLQEYEKRYGPLKIESGGGAAQ